MKNLQPIIYNLQHNRGFTLVETLVAVSVLVVAVAAPLTLAAQSLFAAYYAKDQLTASHLAQEAIEIVRQKRDHNLMEMLSNPAASSEDWLTGTQLYGEPAGTQKIVIVDVEDITNTEFVLISQALGIDDPAAVLQHNGNIYLHGSGEDTRFSRVLELTKVSDSEIEILSTVKWKTGTFKERSFSIKASLYNWIPS